MADKIKQKSNGNGSPNVAGDANGSQFANEINNYNILQNEEDQDFNIINEIFEFVLKNVKDSDPSKVDDHLNVTDKIKLNFIDNSDQNAVSEYYRLAFPKINLIEKRLKEEENEIQNDIQSLVFEMYYKKKSNNKKNIDIMHELFDEFVTNFVPKNKKNDPSYRQMAKSFILFYFDDCTIFEKKSN